MVGFISSIDDVLLCQRGSDDTVEDNIINLTIFVCSFFLCLCCADVYKNVKY